jgi:ABC-type branched-subunit amino acid transport system substrate-binding protein
MFALWLMACILGPRPDACVDSAECRAAFGFGNVCSADGYCEQVTPNPRCEDTFPEDLFRNPENYADALVIGTVFNMNPSGDGGAPADEKQRRSAELAIRNTRDAERTNGDYGQEVAIVHCDNGDNIAYDNLQAVDAAGEAARFLAEDLGIPAIIGPSTSDEAFAVFGAASAHDAIVISPSATSPTLTELGGLPTEDEPGLFWRTVPPDDLQAFAISRDLLDRGVTSIVILHQESSYATALADAVEVNYAGGGRTVTKLSYADLTSLSNQANDVFDAAADEVLFFSSETLDVVTFLDLAGIIPEAADRPIFLADAAADSVLFDVGPAGAALFPNVRGSRPAVPEGPIFDDFASSYFSVYNDQPNDSVFTSYTFDAAWLALYGAVHARQEGAVTGTSIGQGILRLQSGPSLEVGYTSLGDVRDALEAGETVDIVGASGPLDYDAVTGEVSNAIEIWVVDVATESFVPVKICVPGDECTAIE